MRTRGRTSAFIVALAFLLVASACGSGESTEEAEIASPIADFLGHDASLFDDAPEAAEARFIAEERERQQAIADCMAEQGFEYIPNDPSEFISFSSGTDDIDYDSREYAEKYGLGMSTQAFSQDAVGPDLVGHNYNEMDEEAFTDPNHEYMESLDEASRMAYQEALWGADTFGPEIDESMSDEEIEAAFEEFNDEFGFGGPGGCEGEAYEESGGLDNAFWTEFGDELQDMYETAQDDPRITERLQEVASCVSDEGLTMPGTGPEDLYMYFEELLEPIYESHHGGFDEMMMADATEVDGEMVFESAEAEFGEFVEPPLSDENRALLAEIQAEEIALAVAMFDCGGSSQEMGQIFSEVMVEYEQQFLDDNATRLSELKEQHSAS